MLQQKATSVLCSLLPGSLSARVAAAKRSPRVSSPRTAWKPSSGGFVFLESHAVAVPPPFARLPPSLPPPYESWSVLPARNIARDRASTPSDAPARPFACELPRNASSRTFVNKAKKKGRGHAELPAAVHAV